MDPAGVDAMVRFVLRRITVIALVLLGSTAIMYVLTALSADPLADLYDRPPVERDALIAARTEAMRLDLPIPLRYLHWLGEVGRCLLPPWGEGSCTLGLDRTGQPVVERLFPAMGVSIRLVLLATVLSIVIGIMIGVVAALRQYSAFDHSVMLLAFLCFSLPTFWFAGILKQYLAQELNDWLAAPQLGLATILLLAAVAGSIAAVVAGGRLRTRFIVFGATFAGVGGVTILLLSTGWFTHPGLGWAGLIVIGALAALATTALLAGLHDRRILLAAFATAAVGVGCHVLLRLWQPDLDGFGLAIAAVVTLVVSGLIGALIAGERWRLGAAVTVATGLVMAVAVAVEEMMLRYPAYVEIRQGRPIPTAGAATPNLNGDIWLTSLDAAAHLLLPTATLMIVAVAAYVRFARASVLEVRNHEHVRAATARGLPPRLVVVRHVLRNALTPLLTLIGFDFVVIIGGSIVIETLFGWTGGLGEYFVTALNTVDLNPVMGFFVITAAATFFVNLAVDIAYGILDPRVRIA